MTQVLDPRVVQKEYNVYLDSDKAVKKMNGYTFQIQPAIQTFHGSTAEIYVRDFSMMNSICNITGTEAERTLSITTHSGVANHNLNVVPTFHIFPESRYTNGDDFADDLNEIFNNSSSSANNNVKFTWDKRQQKMRFKSTSTEAGGRSVYFFESQPIFNKFLKFNEYMRHGGEIFSAQQGISQTIIDMNRDLHHLYLSCDEVTNSNMSTANDISGRIAKILTDDKFGSYIQYNQNEPIYKSKLDSNTNSKLTLYVFDDSGKYVFPDRFTLTICVLLYAEKPKKEKLGNKHYPLLRPAEFYV